jgi:RNA polymerase sigma-70 factor (ECF subfamily)
MVLSPPDAEERFEALYRSYAGEVLAYCRRRSPGAAEDVLAETFLVVWRRLADVPGEPLPWLFGVARRVLSNQRRASGRREALRERLGNDEHVRDQDAGEPGRLIEALQVLPERDREALLLQAWEGLSAEEAAVALGCSPMAFRLRLHRARRHLAIALRALDAEAASSRELQADRIARRST